MEKFLLYLKSLIPLSSEAQNALVEKISFHEFPKNHVLVKELSLCNHLFVLEEGLARVFYYKDGKEITDWFILEGMVFGPVVRNFPEKAGQHSVELLEPSKVLSIYFNDLQELFDKYHEIERMGRILAIQAIQVLQQRLDSIQFETAEQRYNNLIKTYPSIVQRAPLGQIASYLGVTQVTLSRIRSKAK